MKIRTYLMAAIVAVGMAGFGADAEAKNGPKDIFSIVDLAIQANADLDGEFSTLIAAVVATGLDSVLDGKGQYTVFAPTDEAFAELGLTAEVINGLSEEELESIGLADILLYHVAHGRLLSGDVVEKTKIRTVSKQFLGVTVDEAGVFVNDAAILIGAGLFNLETDNGVVHVIDGVLTPSE